MADDLAELEPFLAKYMNLLGPAQRRKVNRKIGQHLRKANAKRITANVEPDGSTMEPRKRRRRITDAKGKKRLQGRMFRKLRLSRNLPLTVSEDEVEISFAGRLQDTARKHHFGLVGYVDTTPKGKSIKTRYPRRRLLGFGPDDLDEITGIALEMLEP